MLYVFFLDNAVVPTFILNLSLTSRYTFFQAEEVVSIALTTSVFELFAARAGGVVERPFVLTIAVPTFVQRQGTNLRRI